MNNQLDQPEGSDFGRHDHESPSHLGLVLGILVVLLVLIAGGMYLWGASLFKADPDVANNPGFVTPPETGNNNGGGEEEESALSNLESSDEIDFILDDLKKVDIDSIEDELNQIESELFNMWLRENGQEAPSELPGPSEPPPPDDSNL